MKMVNRFVARQVKVDAPAIGITTVMLGASALPTLTSYRTGGTHTALTSQIPIIFGHERETL